MRKILVPRTRPRFVPRRRGRRATLVALNGASEAPAR